MSEREVSGVAHRGIFLHHVTDEIFSCNLKGDTHTHTSGLGMYVGKKVLQQALYIMSYVEITRFRYVIPERRVKLILRLHDFREQYCLTFFIERRISTESETKAFIDLEKREGLKKCSKYRYQCVQFNYQYAYSMLTRWCYSSITASLFCIYVSVSGLTQTWPKVVFYLKIYLRPWADLQSWYSIFLLSLSLTTDVCSHTSQLLYLQNVGDNSNRPTVHCLAVGLLCQNFRSWKNIWKSQDFIN